MTWKRMLIAILLCACCLSARAESLEPLDMDSFAPGPAPSDLAYISDREYQDESITVKLYYGRYAKTDYVCAHVKITHPSQLRTASAANDFRSTSQNGARITEIAKSVNAVVAINGDYYTKAEQCQVAMRQSQQLRNRAEGRDVLLVDTNGDFSDLPNCNREAYKEYLKQHRSEMYNVFCFGPVLVRDGVSVIPKNYENGYIGAQKGTQRSAIAQLGPLEYMIITCSGPQSDDNTGMTIYEFATLCETVGKRLNENGCILAYNLDGGNSAGLVFKGLDKKGNLKYVKVNSTDIGERDLSDIIYFATLVK